MRNYSIRKGKLKSDNGHSERTEPGRGVEESFLPQFMQERFLATLEMTNKKSPDISGDFLISLNFISNHLLFFTLI